MQSQVVTTGQDLVFEKYAYETLWEVSDSDNWVEYPGVRRNPELVKSYTEIYSRKIETEYRTCVASNYGCSNYGCSN